MPRRRMGDFKSENCVSILVDSIRSLLIIFNQMLKLLKVGQVLEASCLTGDSKQS